MDQFQTNAQIYKKFALGAVFLLLALLIIIPIDLQLSKIPNTIDKKFITDNFVVSIGEFRPEQAERAQYVFTTICLPVLIFIFSMANSQWKLFGFITDTTQKLIVSISAVLVIILGIISYFKDGPYYLVSTPFEKNIIAFIGVSLCFTVVTIYFDRWASHSINYNRYRLFNYIYYFLVALVLAIILPYMIARKGNLQTAYFYDGSFDAYFYSIVQVFKGKTILVNLNSQYGLYPYFYLPILKLIGLDITHFSILQVLLYFIFCFMFLLILEKLVRSPWIKLISLLTLVYWTIVLDTAQTPFHFYYQYNPHRIIFPAAIVILCFYYYRRANPPRFLYIVGFLISSAALWWNLETGIPVIAAWVLSLMFDDFSRNSAHLKKFIINSLKHLLVALFFVVFSGAFLYIFSIYRSGLHPNIKDYIFYQSIFYGFGYYMLPMPLFHPWNLVILAYVVGIIQSVAYLSDKVSLSNPNNPVIDLDHRKSMIVFTLSILGVGLFSYYQGRSHDIVLTAVLWPAILLMAIYMDELRQIISRGTGKFPLGNIRSWAGFYLLYGFLILLCLISAVGTITHLKEMANYSLSQFSTSLSVYPPQFQSRIHLIKANTKPNEKVLILAMNSGILYAETNTNNPLPVPGVTELMEKKDLKRIQAYIESPSTKKLFIEPEVIKKFPDLLKSLSKSHLREAGKDKFGNLILYSAQ